MVTSDSKVETRFFFYRALTKRLKNTHTHIQETQLRKDGRTHTHTQETQLRKDGRIHTHTHTHKMANQSA